MKSFSILFFILINIASYSQDWRDGYYITTENDTVWGKILHRKKPSTWQMDFLTKEGKRELYDVNEINGYYYDNTSYVSCKTLIGTYFMKRIVTGQINLYSLNINKFIQKGNDDIEKLNFFLETDILKIYFGDNVELITKIENSDTDTLDIVQLTKEYNHWYKTNSVKDFSNVVDTFSYEANVHDTTTMLEKKDTVGLEIPKQNLFTLKLNILATGVGIETRITNSFSFYIESGISVGLRNYINIYPYIIAQPRIYTNIKKRYKSGKNITKYNGDYISPYFEYIYPIPDLSSNPTNWYLFGLTYGLQRGKADWYYWGFDLGLGIISYQDVTNYDQNTNTYISRYYEPRIIFRFNSGFRF